jgi:esterase/lipase
LSIRSGNESQLYWVDSSGKKTKYVLLYLHGFSASPQEGAPVHLSFAKKYGMNFYAPLLQGHGLVESEPMIDFTAEGFINSAKNAIRLARLMGDSIIIMSTSTGCTAALFLASDPNNQIHSLICYSPNIRVFDKRASLLTGPWGLQISRLVKGGDYNVWQAPVGADQYWHQKYRLEAVIEMQRLLEATMNKETFEKIKCPTFIGYYYKNKEEQDDVVSVPHILEMYDQLGSKQKRKVAFPNAGAHAIASDLFSLTTQAVSDSTYVFAEEVLRLNSLGN